MNTPSTAWHYTGASRLKSIMNDGFLRAHDHVTFTALGTRAPTRPHLWFTLNQFFEPSIFPPLRPELRELRLGGYVGPDWNEYIQDALIESGGSWVRFGIHADVLWPTSLTWPTPEKKEERKIVNDWRVSFKDVPIEGCKIESMDADLEWRRIYTPKQAPWLH